MDHSPYPNVLRVNSPISYSVRAEWRKQSALVLPRAEYRAADADHRAAAFDGQKIVGRHAHRQRVEPFVEKFAFPPDEQIAQVKDESWGKVYEAKRGRIIKLAV